jgi:hypothetical protein
LMLACMLRPRVQIIVSKSEQESLYDVRITAR